jgi:hypothetical protein
MNSGHRTMQFISYDIGADDIITAVGGEWQIFALENAAPSLVDVTGCSLWGFVSGLPTRQAYRELLVRVRGGHEVRFPFRCDGPEIIREMAMLMRPLAGGAVRFESFLLATKPRVVGETMPPMEALRICSWCKRVESANGWRYPDFAAEAFAPFDVHETPAVSFGVCPACAEMLMISPAP